MSWAQPVNQYGQAMYNGASEMGQPILDSMGNIIGYSNQAMNQFGQAMGQGMDAMGQGINAMGQNMNAMGQGMNAMGQGMNAMGQTMGQGLHNGYDMMNQYGNTMAQNAGQFANQSGQYMGGMMNDASQYANQAGQVMGGVANQAMHGARDFAGDASQYANQAGQVMGGIANQAMHGARDFAGDASQYANQAGQVMGGVANQAMHGARDFAGDASQYANQAGQVMGGVANQAMHGARDFAGDASQYANQAGQVMGNVANQAMHGARDFAGDASQYANQAGQVMGGVANQAMHGARDFAGDASQYANQAGQVMGGVANQAMHGARDFAGDASQYANQAGKVIGDVASTTAKNASQIAATTGAAMKDVVGDAGELARTAASNANNVLQQANTLVAPTLANAGQNINEVLGKANVLISGATSQAGVWGSEAVKFSADAIQDASKLTSDVAGATLAELRKVSNEAPRYTAMALAAANSSGDAIRNLSGEAGKNISNLATQSVAFVAAHKGEAAALAAASFSYLHAGANAAKAMVPWNEIQDIYTASRGELAVAAAAMAGAARQMVDWVKFDVIRDFFQTVSLFFAAIASTAIAQAKVVWGNISNVLSVNLNFVIPSIPPYVIYAVLAAIGVIMMIIFVWFARHALKETADEIREGNEAKTWDKMKKERKNFVLFMKYTLIILMSAYLPVSRVCVQILACETSMAKSIKSLGATNINCTVVTAPEGSIFQYTETCDCKQWKPYTGIMVGAIILLIMFTVLFPIFAFRLIKKNIPYGSREDPNRRYNADGIMVEYTDKMYLHDLRNDPRQLSNPFLVLYDGFERKWCYYKVIIMIFKLVVIIPVIVLWNNTVLQTIITLVILAIFFIMSSISRPFVSRVADTMDLSGRITAFLTVLFGLISAPAVAPGTSSVMGSLINITNAINAAVMVFGSLYGIYAVRQYVRGLFGALRFSNTVDDSNGSFERIVLGTPGWDLRLEIKHRIWHRFWRSTLMKAYKKECPKLGERLGELERITADVGRFKIVDHFAALLYPGRGELRKWIADELEGVDVFWDGQTHDGVLDSMTRFGKMYIKPYPFHCVMVYDDSTDFTFIYEKDLDRFVARNTDPEIQRRRGVRKALRALEGELVYCPFERYETHQVEDGTEHYTDSQGKSHTRTRFSSVQVLMHYTSGRIDVGQNKAKQEFSAGFKVTCTFSDGYGSARAPHTGQMKEIRATAVLGAAELDIGTDYHVIGKLATILGHPQNVPIVQSNLPRIYAKERNYRIKLKDDREAEEMQLSNSFWLHIFDADGIPRSALEYYFTNFEANPDLRKLPKVHSKALDFLYTRLAVVRSHPAAEFWYVFWDDIWECNCNSMKPFKRKEVEAFLNPMSATSIAYNPIPRPELEKKLESFNLLSKRRYFTPIILDGLYKKLDDIDKQCREQCLAIAAGRMAVPTMSTTTTIVINSNGKNDNNPSISVTTSSTMSNGTGLQRVASNRSNNRSSVNGVLGRVPGPNMVMPAYSTSMSNEFGQQNPARTV